MKLKNSGNLNTTGLTAVLVMILAGQNAAAFDANEDNDANSSWTMEEVLVTATKKSTTLLRTPAAISAITSDQLGAGGITDVASLQASIPNLSIGNQFGVNRIFIRGIGMTSIDLGADGAVAFLQDGALISRPAAQLAGFFDVERVEVLRGPQGTLYGRGATAGVINLITKRPTKELEGYATATIGNYSAWSFEGALSGPLAGEKIMGRIATKIDQRGGFGENLVTGNDVDDRDAIAVRGSLLFDLADDLSLLVSGEYYREKDNNYGFHYFGTTTVEEDDLPHNALGGRTIFDYQGADANLRDLVSDEDAVNDRDNLAITAIVEWTPGDWSITSVTSYRDFDRFNRDDLDVSDQNVFGQNNYTEKSQSFGEDITLSYQAEGYDLLFGAMYFNETLDGEVLVPLVNFPVAPGVLVDGGNFRQFGTVKTDAIGIFAQATYALTTQLSLTAGVRYNYEKRQGKGSFTFDLLGLNVPTDNSKDWDAITPKATLEYQASDDTLLYATISKGFKSGVINIGSVNDVINPEFVWDYELGFKTRGMDDRLSLSMSAFYYDYTDLQVGFVNAQSIVETRNAASATNYGIEIEGQFQVAEGFVVDFFGTYLNATFEEFTNGDYRQGFALVDLSGKHLPNAPEFSFKIGAEYTLDLAEKGALIFRGDANWQSEVFFTEFNNADAKQDSFALVDVQAMYVPQSDAWYAKIWAKNLTDELIIANNIITAPLYGSIRVGSVGAPRTFGATVGLRF
ncbi:MAG: TonB-dependent receptor [Alphaproteobacteria bacterium]|nr:MAG: TonB-dependent receptor [Alphaproteobacteria bacterium]